MDDYEITKGELLRINADLMDLLNQACGLSDVENDGIAQSKTVSRKISEKVRGETLRVAVIGPIKSGKSTFVNSLLEEDYLKRGAGVVTAIVTRIRRGDAPKAMLYFKSWDEINTEVQSAMAMFPSDQWKLFNNSIDLRREADRRQLDHALTSLRAEAMIVHGQRNADHVVLAHYLKGYDAVKDIVSSESRTKTYAGADFHLHRDFSGNDTRAIYLKDIQLNVNAPVLNGQLEIADCQGSDSPNPHHLAMIQDYLMVTNLVVYVISTRTGLRRADIRFLSMIKKMGIMDNIIFVLNCDFSEHDHVDNLKELVAKIREELAMIRPNADTFTLSSLYNLFSKTKKSLSEKDRARFNQWTQDEALTALSHDETERLGQVLTQKLTRERYPLLVGNHLERLNLSCRGLQHWLNMNRDILNGDADRIKTVLSRLANEKKKSDVLGEMIRSTLDGAISKIKKDIRRDVDRFFDPVSGALIERLVAFVREFRVESDFIDDEVESVGFTTALYNLFQHFKVAVDRFITMTINPEITQFIRNCEVYIGDSFNGIAKPFKAMVQDALVEYNATLSEQGMAPVGTHLQVWIRPSIDAIKSVSGLNLPSATATMRYSARIKSDAVVRYGAYSLTQFIRRVFKKPAQSKHAETRKALYDGMRRIKRETERSLKAHFQDYQEGIKFQYLFKLISGYADLYYETLMDQHQSHRADLSTIADMISQHQTDKQEINHTLDSLADQTAQIIARIDTLTTQMTGGHQDGRKAN